MTNQSQNKRILKYLQSGNSLTPLDALRMFGCFRLGARIYNLKSSGVPIKSELVTKNGKRFARYRLAK